jgi:hypothetical protein
LWKFNTGNTLPRCTFSSRIPAVVRTPSYSIIPKGRIRRYEERIRTVEYIRAVYLKKNWLRKIFGLCCGYKLTAINLTLRQQSASSRPNPAINFEHVFRGETIKPATLSLLLTRILLSQRLFRFLVPLFEFIDRISLSWLFIFTFRYTSRSNSALRKRLRLVLEKARRKNSSSYKSVLLWKCRTYRASSPSPFCLLL